jgi:hypothetical protein
MSLGPSKYSTVPLANRSAATQVGEGVTNMPHTAQRASPPGEGGRAGGAARAAPALSDTNNKEANQLRHVMDGLSPEGTGDGIHRKT